MANPYSELEKAIIAKLEGDGSWIWDIFPKIKNPKSPYLEITSTAGGDASTKESPVYDFLVSFEAVDARYTASTGTNDYVMEMLYTMETILTLNNHSSGLTKLTLGGGFRDASHLPDIGPEILPNPDKSIRRARQIIKFTVER